MNPYSRPPGRPDPRRNAAAPRPRTDAPQNRPRIPTERQARIPGQYPPGTRPPSQRPAGQQPRPRPTGQIPSGRPESPRPAGQPIREQIPPRLQPGSPRPGTRRPLPPEAEARRRAAIAARNRARRRAARIRLFAMLFIAAVALILLAVCIRSCRDAESVPVGGTDDSGIGSTPADSSSDSASDSVSAEESTDPAPPETDPPRIAPFVNRPSRDAAAITLTDEIASEYGVLIALSSNTILAEKSANARIYPASMTKVMTLIVAYEHIENLSDTCTVTSTIIDPLYRAGATLAGFAPGEEVTLRDLLYGVILPSGAEASVALAEYVAGSEAAFAEMMNEKAADMGLVGTHFTNCTGLHDAEHYSTPVEMAMILAYAMQYEECAQILSTYRYTTAPTEKHPEGVPLESTMFSRMYGDEPEGVTVLAGKTGYTNEAHHCLVSYAEDDETGAAYIFVSASATEKFAPVFDAITVYSDYTE